MLNLLFNDAYIVIMYNLPCVLPKLRKATQRGGGLIIADVNIDKSDGKLNIRKRSQHCDTM